MASDPLPVDANALEVLDDLLARAFGIEGGYKELNGIVSADDAAGYDMFEELGLYDSPMKLIVPALRQALQAKGEATERACLQALFVKLPGNFELREWVGSYCPAMVALVPQQMFEDLRAAYDKDRMDRRVRGMSTSLSELDIKLQPAQQQLARRMIRKLDELNDYKAIHDTLHGLQGETLNELGRISGRQILGVERRRSLGAQIMLLQAAAEKIGGKFADPGAPDLAATLRAMVVTAIQTIIKTLQKADPEARETPEAGAGMLRALLRQQMGPFDNKLVETVDEIPFADFAAMLTALPQAAGATATAPSGDPILAANVGASFEDIRSRLVRRRTVHTLWQQVEATLLNVEELLRGKGRAIELRAHWENLSGLVEQIGVLSVEQGLFTLPMPADADLTADEFAVKARSKDYRREFDFFAREARARFQWADNALLNDCETLERLQQPLRALVGDG